MDLTYFLPVLYAFIASLGFGGLYNLHGRAPLFWAAVGGALGWLAYLITLLAFPDVFAGFVSAAVVASGCGAVILSHQNPGIHLRNCSL